MELERSINLGNTNPTSLPAVREYYTDKNVLVTGATGFIGKALLEKLLRDCPEIKAIYCLIRPRDGRNASERLDDMLQQHLFTKLEEAHPGYRRKLHAIHGDILEEGLGLREDHAKVLRDNVNIVFHAAASIKFDEHLRLALQLNLLGVRRMIKFCRTLNHLQVFVHVSSAYANCDRQYIEENVYSAPVDPQKIVDALEWMDDDMITEVTPKLIGDKPNTFTYTKQLAETLLVQEGSDLPLAIVRPSIVTAAWREPMAGWIDQWHGPSALYVAAGRGILRCMKADSRTIADMIPVDLPVNMMIAVAWYTAVGKPAKNAQVYQITTGGLNPFTWGEMENVVMSYFKRNPLEACFRRPKMHFTTNNFLHDYWVLVSHLIPAYAVDAGYILLGKKPRMVKTYNKLHKALGSLEYFTVRSWEWSHYNMDMLRSKLSKQDQKIFYFDPRELHWPTYIENFCLGTKKYILKEDVKGLPAARAHLKKLRNIRYTFNTVLLVVLWRLLIARSQLARNSWYLVVGLIYKFVQFFRLTSTIKRE